MKTIKYFPLLLLLSLACSLTASPSASSMEAKPVNKISLTTPTHIPNTAVPTIPAKCVVNAQSLHLRTCAGLKCTVISWLSHGDELVVQEKDQDWIRVVSPAGQTGWVHSKYCGGLP